MEALLRLFLWIASAFFCASLASHKGHNAVAWFFGGFFCGPLALIAAVGLPDRKKWH